MCIRDRSWSGWWCRRGRGAGWNSWCTRGWPTWCCRSCRGCRRRWTSTGATSTSTSTPSRCWSRRSRSRPGRTARWAPTPPASACSGGGPPRVVAMRDDSTPRPATPPAPHTHRGARDVRETDGSLLPRRTAARRYALRRSFTEFVRDQGLDEAAALTYNSVVSLLPAVLVMLAVLGLVGQGEPCLLYTSDAADDLLCV